MSEIRVTRAPLEHGTAVLIGALMKRLGVERVTLDESDLADVPVIGSWDYAGGTLTLEVER